MSRSGADSDGSDCNLAFVVAVLDSCCSRPRGLLQLQLGCLMSPSHQPIRRPRECVLRMPYREIGSPGHCVALEVSKSNNPD